MLSDLTNYVRVGPILVYYPDILDGLVEHINKGKPGQFAEPDAVRLEQLAKSIRALNEQHVLAASP